jgi:hypothetical protein
LALIVLSYSGLSKKGLLGESHMGCFDSDIAGGELGTESTIVDVVAVRCYGLSTIASQWVVRRVPLRSQCSAADGTGAWQARL